jgi:hypothetical protein
MKVILFVSTAACLVFTFIFVVLALVCVLFVAFSHLAIPPYFKVLLAFPIIQPLTSPFSWQNRSYIYGM